MNKVGIVFFGSGPVASASLELLSQSFDIEAVVTKPKPAHHRGAFPVLECAETLSLTTYTVSNRAELSQLIKTEPFKSKLAILIDFGIIVAQDVIDYFPHGIINSHFSLLPEWRGADPISFAILSGQKATGVSLMLIDVGMDTGKLLATKKLHIEPEETTEGLTAKLIQLSYKMLVTVTPQYLKGKVTPRLQPHQDRATYSRKLTKQDGLIDWGKPAEIIEREIRAFATWPKSHTVLGGKEVIITAAHVTSSDLENEKPGTIRIIGNGLGVATASGTLWIDSLKPAGKKEMPAESFLAGYKNLL